MTRFRILHEWVQPRGCALLLVSTVTLLASCGGSDDDTFEPGTGGAGGSSGADSGTGGTGGTGGSVGGTGGASGQGGTGLGGSGGTTEVGGAAGSGGSGGTSAGCLSDDDCAATPSTPYCTSEGTCVACESGNANHACPTGLTCCTNDCVDTTNDLANCGACDNTCSLPNADAACALGQCVVASCSDGFVDCDSDASNGCESTSAECACTPGAVEACYTGPAGTQDVGPCKGGVRTCNAAGSGWSACEGQVLPAPDSCLNSIDDDCDGTVNNGFPNAPGCFCLPGEQTACYSGPPGTQDVGPCKGGTATCGPLGASYGLCSGEVVPVDEVCANGVDDDCNGTVDDSPDADGDGWTVCEGDCCDSVGPACSTPLLVNPGAIEVPGDQVDNNCNGVVDEDPAVTCSTGSKFAATSAWDLLRAMEICETSTGGSWGVVGTPVISRADGSGAGTVSNLQVAVSTQFGTHASNLPRFGDNVAILSSGRARDANDPDPTQGVTYSYLSGSPPPDFVAPYGGQLPATSTSCPNGSGANDSVMLDVRLKAPTNANSFSFQFRFFSQEYMTWTCTQFNDFFIAMLDSSWLPGPGQTAIPLDKNISFDANGRYISVNSQQFFTVCAPKTGYPCPDGTAALGGTGYSTEGGSTVWLTTTAPVVPGETIRLRFTIWDTSDQAWDSLVLLDNFRWSATPSGGPVTE